MTTSSIKTEVPVAKKLMGQRSQEESQLLDPAGGQSLLLDPFLGSESTSRPIGGIRVEGGAVQGVAVQGGTVQGGPRCVAYPVSLTVL